ncbi:MAG: hypothetical protein RL513_1590 [Pseudomonadota bacterium]
MQRFSYTARMPKEFQAGALDVKAFAEAGAELAGAATIGDFGRLLSETEDRGAQRSLAWSARGELRNPLHVQPDVWLHLKARGVLPLTCQRCLGPVDVTVSIERSFRFVADEATAEAQDDACEEDLLVTSRSFDLTGLLEDEFLMELPLVPLHETCPEPVRLSAEDPGFEHESPQESPFAVLARLKADGKDRAR